MNFDQVSHKPPYVKAEWLEKTVWDDVRFFLNRYRSGSESRWGTMTRRRSAKSVREPGESA
jgi:hypothetical protein